MAWHEHLDQAWGYIVQNAAIFVGKILGFDPEPFVPWVQFIAASLAIILSLWGLLNLWRKLEGYRIKLLRDYLEAQEKRILSEKEAIAKRLSNSKTKRREKLEAINVHKTIDQAVALFDKGKVSSAERKLGALRDLLGERRDIAKEQLALAQKQKGAIHLFLGSIAASRSRHKDAIQEFEACMKLNPKDLDAQRYLIGQHLVRAAKDQDTRTVHIEKANQEIDNFRNLANVDASLLAQVHMFKGRALWISGEVRKPKIEFKRANQFADRTNDKELIAEVNYDLGVFCWEKSQWNDAEEAFKKSQSNYKDSGRSLEANLCKLGLAAVDQRVLKDEATEYIDFKELHHL